MSSQHLQVRPMSMEIASKVSIHQLFVSSGRFRIYDFILLLFSECLKSGIVLFLSFVLICCLYVALRL